MNPENFRSVRRRALGLALGFSAACCLLPVQAQTVAADCATPGNDGNNFSIAGIVNSYYPGTANVAAGGRCISVGTRTGAATPIAAGDLLLVIQMQHATINNGDNSSYGDNVAGAPGGVTNHQTAGRYEYVAALGAVGASGGVGCGAGQVAIKGRGTSAGLINAYTSAARSGSTGRQTFQVIRVPQYNAAGFSGAVNAAYWDGNTGGVAVIDVVGRLDFGGQTLNANGRGFRGGGGRGLGGDGGAGNTDYRRAVTLNAHGAKGEGIAGTTRYLYNQETGALIDFAADEGYNNGGAARGAPGNAGGGGTDSNAIANDENSGGGGGANGGAGGIGGNAWQSNAVNGGHGGGAFAPGGTALDRIVLGGGGGAGARNNSANRQSSGGAGGGMILVQTGEFRGTGSITSNGAQGPFPDNDGGGGGGGGGTVVLRDHDGITTSDATGITISVAGAAGSNAWPNQAPGGTPGARHGPGGGGGGGRILLGPFLATGTTSFDGGVAGITTTANDTYGAGPGLTGSSASYTGTPPGILPGFQCAPLPVTLAHVDLRADGAGTKAVWATASERNTVSFQWFADAQAKSALQDKPTPSPRGNAAEPTGYQTLLKPAAGGRYWLAEYDHRGNREMHGPYEIGKPVGRSPLGQMIEWESINAQKRAAAKLRVGNAQSARLWVSERGFQRVRHEDLLAQGIDLGGVSNASIAVLRGAVPVPRRIAGASELFGDGSYIEFFAEPRNSLYGAEAVYRLVVDSAFARTITRDEREPGPSRPAWAWYNADYAPQNAYNFASPTDDPWYADRLLAFAGTPAGKDISLALSAIAQVPQVAHLQADLIGVTNWAGLDPDHHVRLSIGGQPVTEVIADGLTVFDLQYEMLLNTATQSIDARVEATGATGYSFDVVNIERVRLRYPRLAQAESGRWFADAVRHDGVQNDPSEQPPLGVSGELLADGFEDAVEVSRIDSLRVRNLPNAEVVAYARSGSTWRYLPNTRTLAAGSGWSAFLPGVKANDAVYVASTAAIARPRITSEPVLVDIQSGAASYLVISHAQFMQAAAPLLQHRQGQGMSTALVDVDQIYAQYGTGEPDPAAIQAYIAMAKARRGTRYVVIVGGDTYDYHDYLGVHSVSFVPTIYRATGEVVRYAPLDSVYADVDLDGVPDLAIGRLPVRTEAELATAISKIIQAETPRAAHSALLVSGASDPGNSFAGMNEDFAAQLSGNWALERADVDAIGVAAARAALFNGWGAGPTLISYVGHSAPGQWTYDPLLTAGDVASLASSPMVPTVAQWGCWNTYFVSPTANSLGQALLLQGAHGAAAIYGPAALTDISNHRGLAPGVFGGFAPGLRVGDVILRARIDLAAAGTRSTESMLGGNLLGDPAMILP